MPKIKYVGVKQDGETAFSHATKITWFPGDSHEIADEKLVKQMLQHPDVFAEDTGKAKAAPAPAPTPAPTAAPAAKTGALDTAEGTGGSLAPGGVIGATAAPALHTIDLPEGKLVLDAMEAPELHDLAKKLGVKVHHAAGAAKVRDALVASQKPTKAKK